VFQVAWRVAANWSGQRGEETDGQQKREERGGEGRAADRETTRHE
jgi:hypothetical protein